VDNALVQALIAANRAACGSKLTPHERLMYAVLQDAVEEYLTFRASDGEPGWWDEEAQSWFRSADIDWPFSFLNICTTLGLDPDYIRAGLFAWEAS
jgi:hypothetical protein